MAIHHYTNKRPDSIGYSWTQFVVPRDAGLFAPGGRMQTGCDNVCDIYIYIYVLYVDLEPKWPQFLKVNSPKQDLFQPKQGSFGL